jgi:hypothetical protein
MPRTGGRASRGPSLPVFFFSFKVAMSIQKIGP